MFKKLRSLFSGSKRRAPERRSVQLTAEQLEDRVVPVANTWAAPPLQAGQTSLAWNTDTNWLLGHKPTATETAVFDADNSTTPCLLQGAAAAPAGVQFDANWPGATVLMVNGRPTTPTVTVNANLTTPALTLNARTDPGNPAGPELVIGAGTQVEVTNTLTFAGGNVSGSGTLLVDRGGTLNLTGSSANDPPTLGCPLQVGSPDGTTAGTLWDGGGPWQPLVVTGNASITANPQGTIDLIHLVPFTGQNFVNAISNGDGGRETITLNGGSLTSNNANETFVGMGVTMSAGQINVQAQGGQGAGPLHFTGLNAAGTGLQMSGGQILDESNLTVDQGTTISGGTIQEQNTTSTLTLGLAFNSPPTEMTGGDFQLVGVLVSHGGFNLDGGTMETNGSTASRVQLDASNKLLLGGGSLTVTAADNNRHVTGQLTVNGDFEADAGSITIQVNSSDGSQGNLQVNGNVTLGGTGAIIFSDVSLMPIEHNWLNVFTWTGTRDGTLAVQPAGWSPVWAGRALWVNEPPPR